MTTPTRLLTGLALLLMAALSPARDDATLGANLQAQAAADALREFASADVALLPAGLLRENAPKEDLAALLAYPSETLVVVGVTGSQLREAMERSVSLYPQPNVGFLQLSGMDVTFSRSAPSNSRIVSVAVGGVRLEDGRTYEVAMPSSLQRGLLGYTRLWDKSKIVRQYDKAPLGEILKGRKPVEGTARWSAQG